jgi:hypothetical protein
MRVHGGRSLFEDATYVPSRHPTRASILNRDVEPPVVLLNLDDPGMSAVGHTIETAQSSGLLMKRYPEVVGSTKLHLVACPRGLRGSGGRRGENEHERPYNPKHE